MTTSQNLTVGTGASVQSTTIPTTKVRFTSNAAVHVTVGVNPIANTANCELIAANQTRYINMEGLHNKLAVIASSSVAEISIVNCGEVFVAPLL